jgi:hypothetical protein
LIIGGSKEIFLKNLSEALFVGSTLLDEENTILIDDSPEKCVCNDRGDCLFLKIWIPLDSTDDFLIRMLAPWLLRLHSNCSRGQLRDFVNSNRIGVPPLAADSRTLTYSKWDGTFFKEHSRKLRSFRSPWFCNSRKKKVSVRSG